MKTKKKTDKPKGDIPIWKQIDLLCEMHGLSEDVKKDIEELSKMSYCAGSKDCYQIYFSNKIKNN